LFQKLLLLQQFERYMESNDVKKGGSFYLQSKFYRANELLMEYIEEEQKKSGTTAGVPPKRPDADEDNNTSESAQSTTDQQQQQSK